MKHYGRTQTGRMVGPGMYSIKVRGGERPCRIPREKDAAHDLEERAFSYGVGVRYDIVKYVSILPGMQDLAFPTGVAILWRRRASLCTMNYGYNNIASMQMLF